MQWENGKKKELLLTELDDDDDEDDQKSISSESSCFDGLPTESPLRHKKFKSQSNDFDIWRMFQIDDHILKDLPNGEKILDALTADKWDGEFAF